MESASTHILSSRPNAPPTFTATPTSILEDTSRAIERYRQAQDNIVKDAAGCAVTFEAHVLPLAYAENEMLMATRALGFYQHVSPKSDVRDASRRANGLITAFSAETAMRDDLSQIVTKVFEDQGNEIVDEESRYFLQILHRERIRNGAALPPDASERKRLIEIRRRLDDLASQFLANLAEQKGDKAWYPAEELEALPKSLLDKYPKGTGDHIGQIFAPAGPVEGRARNGTTRRRAELLSCTGCVQNVPILTETLKLRDEAAHLLGYPTSAAYSIEVRMAKSPGRVRSFLADLQLRLAVNSRTQMERLKEAKKDDLKSRNGPDDGHFYTWDLMYYQAKIREKAPQSRSYNYSEYFELQTVLTGMIALCHHIFGVQLVEISDQARDRIAPNGKGLDIVWHEDVQLLAAWDTAEADSDHSRTFLGYLYLDLYHRPGKYTGNSMFTIIPGFHKQDGKRQIQSAALIWNFDKPDLQNGGTCNLPHHEVVQLFHELGHGIHNLVSKTRFARFHGPDATPVDFGEAPSQMLENWCWSPEVLKILGKHYSYVSPEMYEIWKMRTNEENPQQPPMQMPDEMIEYLIATRHRGGAINHLHNLIPAVFDMDAHELKTRDVDPQALYADARRKTYPHDLESDSAPEWGNNFTKFTHFVGDYDAGYYSYFYSNLYASDMFDTFFEADPMSAEEGRRYRRAVLEKGGSQDPLKIMEDYLGRPVMTDGFYKMLGLT